MDLQIDTIKTMKIGLIGATGPLGSEILKKLNNSKVSVYVRNPTKLTANANLEITQGELTDTQKLNDWADHQDIVLLALGHTTYLSQLLANIGLSKYPNENMMSNVLEILLKSKVKRIVYCSAYGTRETKQYLPFYFAKIMLPLLIKHSYADHERSEELLEKCQKEWVVARPAMLTHKDGTGSYTAEKILNPKAKGVIARADVADFMVKAATQNNFLNQMIGLSY